MKGPRAAVKIDGSLAWEFSTSMTRIGIPFLRLERNVERMIVTVSATIDGMIFFIMREVSSTSNASATASVFGFGEMMFPA